MRVGKVKPGGRSSYANVEGDPKVFLLNPGVVEQFGAELHSGKVLGFNPADAERVVLRWPSRTVSLEKKARRRPGSPRPGRSRPGYDTAGVDLSRVDAIVGPVRPEDAPVPPVFRPDPGRRGTGDARGWPSG